MCGATHRESPHTLSKSSNICKSQLTLCITSFDWEHVIGVLSNESQLNAVELDSNAGRNELASA